MVIALVGLFLMVVLDVCAALDGRRRARWRALSLVPALPIWLAVAVAYFLLRVWVVPFAIVLLVVSLIVIRLKGRIRVALRLSVLTVAACGSAVAGYILFRGWPPVCGGIENQAGVRRLDAGPIQGTPFGLRNVGAYGVALSSAGDAVFVTYAHSGKIGRDAFSGIGRIPLSGRGRAGFSTFGRGDVHRVRVDSKYRRVYALDMHEGTIHVFSEDPFLPIKRVRTGSNELTDVVSDPDRGLLYAIDRSVPSQVGNLLVFDLADPGEPVRRIPTPPGTRGSAEFVTKPGQPHAFVYTESFFRLMRFSFPAGRVDRVATSRMPGGFLDGVLDDRAGVVYFSNLFGFVQARSTEDMGVLRTFWVRPGIRAMGLHPGSGKIYLADYFEGSLVAVNGTNGEQTGRLRIGAQSREMAVSNRGFLYVPSVCGVFEVDTSAVDGF